MAQVDDMLARLPTLYRDGALVRGLLAQPGLQLAFVEADLQAVQRSHAFDAAYDFADVQALGALLDLPAEPWHTLRTYRAWVHALRDAVLRYGTVTAPAAVRFVAAYAAGHAAATGLRLVPPLPPDVRDWARVPDPLAEPAADAAPAAVRAERGPVFVENPVRTVYRRVPEAAGMEPLHRFVLTQAGLDPAPAGFLLEGLPGGSEFVPALVNLTTGRALVYRGEVATGRRLVLRPTADGATEALLDGQNVTDRLYGVEGVAPGTPWPADAAVQPAPALTLPPGDNDLWFLPLAHYDDAGLDRFLLALDDLSMTQGRYDDTAFDRALFYQDPAVRVTVGWAETQPAAYAVRLPGGMLVRPADTDETDDEAAAARDAALAERDQLAASLQLGLDRLRGAGIRAAAHLDAFADAQPQTDRLAAVLPKTVRDAGSAGADRLTDASGHFDVTHYHDSTFR